MKILLVRSLLRWAGDLPFHPNTSPHQHPHPSHTYPSLGRGIGTLPLHHDSLNGCYLQGNCFRAKQRAVHACTSPGTSEACFSCAGGSGGGAYISVDFGEADSSFSPGRVFGSQILLDGVSAFNNLAGKRVMGPGIQVLVHPWRARLVLGGGACDAPRDPAYGVQPSMPCAERRWG